MFAFAASDDVGAEDGELAAFSRFMLDDPTSPRNQLVEKGNSFEDIVDTRAILQQDYRTVDCINMPPLFKPQTGALGVVDYEKVFCAIEGDDDVFDLRGINRQKGCIVIIRPDQYIADIRPINAMLSLHLTFGGILKGLKS